MRDKYHQGKFKPQYPEKYKGNPNNIVYRSSWELKFMRWCDTNPNILEWGSEEFFIPYYDPTSNKLRKYFPDFIVKIKDNTEKIKKYVVEVKPKKQTKPPSSTPKKKTKSWANEVKTYLINEAKWKAATEFCLDRSLIFKIITEDDLGIR
jgi:hypothetical protein